MTKAKLSEIWAWAAKELTQVQGDWGEPTANTACALGAIEMFRTDKKSVVPNWGLWREESYMAALRQFIGAVMPNRMEESGDHKDLADRSNVYRIMDLNDVDGWTFAALSKKAKELEDAGVIT
jgi:hypothetical protein